MKKISTGILFLIGLVLVLWKVMTAAQVSRVGDEGSSQVITKGAVVTTTSLANQNDSKIELSDYQSKLDRDLKSLPIIDDLQNLTADEVHHTPEIIKNGGELIGKIHDEAELDPAKRVDAMNFFKNCTEDKQIATAIRAVCLNKVYKLVPIWKIPVPLSEADIPAEVSDLALKLP